MFIVGKSFFSETLSKLNIKTIGSLCVIHILSGILSLAEKQGQVKDILGQYLQLTKIKHKYANPNRHAKLLKCATNKNVHNHIYRF